MIDHPKQETIFHEKNHVHHFGNWVFFEFFLENLKR